jgi:hypothetical protein
MNNGVNEIINPLNLFLENTALIANKTKAANEPMENIKKNQQCSLGSVSKKYHIP